jgi:hypothetical protein
MRGTAFMNSLPPGEDARAQLVLDAVRGGVALPIA